ncbi:MAG: hypothetical protein GW772_12815 [Flavobacteriia bacterium]|nr:hypothetical protein [Flavobacteriia bacterium]NCT61363.1 hypothetical protein [Flavobacteriia bacterium]
MRLNKGINYSIISLFMNISLLENSRVVFLSPISNVLNYSYYETEEKLDNCMLTESFLGGKYSLLEVGAKILFIPYRKTRIKGVVSKGILLKSDLLANFQNLTDLDTEFYRTTNNFFEILFDKSSKGIDDLFTKTDSRNTYKKADWILIPP